MLYNNVFLTVKSADEIDRVRSLLQEQARLSSDEPGCLRFEVYQSQSQPQEFMLVEQWESEEDLARHREAKAFTELYLPQVIPRVDRTPHLCDRVWPR